MALSDDTSLKALRTRWGLTDFSGSLTELVQNIPRLNDARDLNRWLESDVFKPGWDTLVANYLQELVDNARARNIELVQGPNFDAVRGRLIHGERGGRMKFSSRFLHDRSAWDATDHLAKFLFDIVDENISHYDSIFYHLPMEMVKRQWIIWQVYLYKRSTLAPTKRKFDDIEQGVGQQESGTSGRPYQSISISPTTSNINGPILPNRVPTHPPITPNTTMFTSLISQSDKATSDNPTAHDPLATNIGGDGQQQHHTSPEDERRETQIKPESPLDDGNILFSDGPGCTQASKPYHT